MKSKKKTQERKAFRESVKEKFPSHTGWLQVLETKCQRHEFCHCCCYCHRRGVEVRGFRPPPSLYGHCRRHQPGENTAPQGRCSHRVGGYNSDHLRQQFPSACPLSQGMRLLRHWPPSPCRFQKLPNQQSLTCPACLFGPNPTCPFTYPHTRSPSRNETQRV